jgi:ribosomal protein S18 acetylase RimI-like enzyme
VAAEVAMDVRAMQPGDLDAVTELFLQSYSDGWTAEQARTYLEKFFGFEPASCLVGIDPRGNIAGAILGYSYPRGPELILFVQELFVHPAARNQGWGRKLFSALRGRFSENPKVNIKPLVKAPPHVHRFYNSLGFDREQAFSFYDE